ncbi:tetratricopeptide repeat protein [Microcoleus sp. w1-18aA5]|uniref:tetratricopeptide repeat protein n=1 Tax=Microcoleus sp. w1-18aA5 TaxID=2818982 RepID=UPI002FD28234
MTKIQKGWLCSITLNGFWLVCRSHFRFSFRQPVAAVVPVGKALQTAQTNSSSVSSVTKKLYEEAEKLYKQRTPEGFRGAIANSKEALKLFRAEGNGRGEGILYFIGLAYSQLGEKQKALEYYSHSLSLARGEGSSIDEATSLTGIGLVYPQLGEKQKALEYYSQSFPLSRSVSDLHQEGITLYHIATRAYYRNRSQDI